MNGSVKRMDIAEFRRLGYLQEVNRQFFHPLGLALEVVEVEEDGSMRLGGIWDCRDDPEGMIFEERSLDLVKARYVETEQRRFAAARETRLGYIVQPVETTE